MTDFSLQTTGFEATASSSRVTLPGRAPVEDVTSFRDHLAARAGADEAREAAEQLVSATFIEPVLAMIRETSEGEGPYAPGAAERRFGPLLDQELAGHIVRGARFPLVDVIADRLRGKA